MPRPRFEKLPEERRTAILAVAAEEFAEHGFEAASYNRIIERSGLSKGAIYYYFDDKEDLYAATLRDAMQRLVLDVGNMAAATDAESFWREFEVWYVRSLEAFQREPHAVGLARSLVKALSRGAASNALVELRQFARGFMDMFIAQGQALGAIRDDLPHDLLRGLLMAMEEGIDLWLGERIGGMTPKEIASAAAMLTRVYRRLAAPDDAGAPPRPAPEKTSRDPRRAKTKKR